MVLQIQYSCTVRLFTPTCDNPVAKAPARVLVQTLSLARLLSTGLYKGKHSPPFAPVSVSLPGLTPLLLQAPEPGVLTLVLARRPATAFRRGAVVDRLSL